MPGVHKYPGLNLRLDTRLVARLTAFAKRVGKSRTQVASEAIDKYITENEKGNDNP